MNGSTGGRPLRNDCQEEGLDCRSCIEAASRDLAIVCQEMDGAAAQAIFLRLHTRRACRGMAAEFRAMYERQREQVRREAELESPFVRIAQCA